MFSGLMICTAAVEVSLKFEMKLNNAYSVDSFVLKKTHSGYNDNVVFHIQDTFAVCFSDQ